VVETPDLSGVFASNLSSSLDEALSVLFTLGTGALHARRCSLYLRANEEADLALYHATGLPATDCARRVALQGTIMGMVARSRVPLLVQNVATYPTLPAHPDRYTTGSFLSVPILVENEAIGVLNAADRQDGHPFTDDDLQSAEMVARSMAAVLHSDLLAQRARDGGEIDPVTGLYNARHFEKRLTQEVERALRARLPLTLLLLGVTSYDDIARRIGSQSAGLLMRSIGEIVAQTVRQSDVLARRTESEIAILLPSTPLDKARRVARTIAREVVHDRLPAALRYDLESLHVSVGLAALGPDMQLADLVAQAAMALDQAVTRGDTIVAAAGDDIVEVPRRIPPRTTQQQSIVNALRLGVPYLANPADAATLTAIQLVSRDMARRYLCFPIAVESGTLTLAMADPVDAAAIEAVSQRTRLAVFPVASPREKILQAIATRMDEQDAERTAERFSFELQAEHGLRAVMGRLESLGRAFPDLRDDALIIDTTLGIQASSAQHRAILAEVGAWLRDAPRRIEDY